jgi:hypothetical protein
MAISSLRENGMMRFLLGEMNSSVPGLKANLTGNNLLFYVGKALPIAGPGRTMNEAL